MTYPQPAQQRSKSGNGWFLVLGAAVLGVFVFCGIVVAAAGSSEQPAETRDVSLALTSRSASPQTSSAPPATTAPAAAAVQTTTSPPPAPPAATTAAAPRTTAPRTTKPAAPRTTAAKPPSNCNPNYTPCVPNASDVDCAGGSGDGPAYVQGPVKVIGTDVYRLDHDKNGIGCE